MWRERAATARALLRAANGLGSRRAEALWGAASAVAGRWLRPRPGTWRTSGCERVVVIAPHPDDEAVGCAGTALRHQQRGDAVHVAVVTDGSRSRALGLDRESMGLCREREARAAAARMGARCHWLGLREGDWSEERACAAIRHALTEIDAAVVYAPSAIDYHPEHRRVAAVLASVLSESGFAPEVRVYAIQVPLTPLLINVVHDVSDLEDPIRAVLACYASQRQTLVNASRLRRYAARFYGMGTQVEGFCAMPASLYCALHRRPQGSFRGLGHRAWKDPLALGAGVPERLAWSRLAQANDRLRVVEASR
jgi:LmbE family N-acetylglucosaminyl deacetylase